MKKARNIQYRLLSFSGMKVIIMIIFLNQHGKQKHTMSNIGLKINKTLTEKQILIVREHLGTLKL